MTFQFYDLKKKITVHTASRLWPQSEGENSLGKQFDFRSQRSLVFLWKYSTGISQKTAGTDEPLTFFFYNFWFSKVTERIIDNSSFGLEVKEILKCIYIRKYIKYSVSCHLLNLYYMPGNGLVLYMNSY